MRKFTVYGTPVAKARARKGSRGNWYTPQKTVDYEQLVIDSYNLKYRKENLMQGAIEMNLKIYMKIPKSYSKKKKKEALTLPHLKKPDADNIIKSIADSLNGVAYKDDNQVFKGSWEKWYSEKPRVEVIIKEF